MKAKKHCRRWFDPSRPLPDWDSDFWIGVLKNASSLLRRIEKANRKGKRRRARYLQRVYDNSLAPHAMALIFEHEFQEPTSPSAQSADRVSCRR